MRSIKVEGLDIPWTAASRRLIQPSVMAKRNLNVVSAVPWAHEKTMSSSCRRSLNEVCLYFIL